MTFITLRKASRGYLGGVGGDGIGGLIVVTELNASLVEEGLLNGSIVVEGLLTGTLILEEEIGADINE